MVTAIYPGTFDPVTLGHVDISSRASLLFDRVIVAVYSTPSKNLLFTTDERVGLFKESVAHLSNVEVVEFEGLVVRFAHEVGAAVIVRGLRSGSDFEYEFDLYSKPPTLHLATIKCPTDLQTFQPQEQIVQNGLIGL